MASKKAAKTNAPEEETKVPDQHVTALLDISWQSDINKILGDLGLWQQAITYEGFDPRFLVAKLLSIEPDMEKLKTDISFMLTAYLERGNNIEKAQVKMKDAGKKKYLELQSKYKLENRVGSLGKGAITLSRMSACFPLLTLTVMKDVPNLRVIGTPGRVPKHWCFPAAAALLDNLESDFAVEWLAWSSSFAATIGGKSDAPTVLSYARIAQRSTLLPAKERVPATSTIPAIKNRALN